MIAPVGVGNITLGFFRSPDSLSPPGFENVVLPVHMKVEDPTNQTIIEQDIITPYSLKIDFKKVNAEREKLIPIATELSKRLSKLFGHPSIN